MTDSFLDFWDNCIRDWAETGEIPASESFWFDEQRHQALHSCLMPEPYWGDIDDNSVVLVNFNPAGSVSEDITDTCHLVNKHDRSTVCVVQIQWHSMRFSAFGWISDSVCGGLLVAETCEMGPAIRSRQSQKSFRYGTLCLALEKVGGWEIRLEIPRNKK